MHPTISLLLAAAMWQCWASFMHIATICMLSTAATTMASMPCPCAVLCHASSRSGYSVLEYPLGLIRKPWNRSLVLGKFGPVIVHESV